MKKIAAIDIGTNSFLCLIAEVSQGEIINIVEDHSVLVRLGEGVHQSRIFHVEALKRAKECLSEFKNQIDLHGVDEVRAVATSAARDVTNGGDLLQIGNDLGIPIEIITGQREAELTYSGGMEGKKRQGALVLDIGGGSTEYIVENSSGICGKSIDVGGVRLTEKFVTSHPVKEEEMQQMTAYAKQEIEKQLSLLKSSYLVRYLIAVAGTPTTLANIEIGGKYDANNIEGYQLTKQRISHWLDTLAALSVEERVRQFSISSKRADILVAGCVILLASLEYWGLNQLTVSTRGVRYGLICE